MAKNADKATGKKPAIDVASSGLPENLAAKIGETIAKFGEEKVAEAVKMATGAIRGVVGVDSEIEQLQSAIAGKELGKTAYLWQLAKDCVVLTMKGKRAFLEDAADLMRAACNFAEDTYLAEDATAHSGVRRKMGDISKSWGVLKSKAISALGKANLDPRKFAGGTEYIQTAYDAWTKDPKNASAKSSRGRKESDPGKVKVDGKVTPEAAKVAAAMNDGGIIPAAQTVLAKLVAVMKDSPQGVQALAVPMIKAMITAIQALEVPTPKEAGDATEAADKAAGVVTRRRPNPARVPESNQVAG